MDEHFKRSLDIHDDLIIRHIPYLLQDLYTLGGQPEIIRDLLQRNHILDTPKKVLDLGCGKGAALALLARDFRGEYLGIDIMREFIRQGQERLRGVNLRGKVMLITGDMSDAIGPESSCDVVIYGHDTDVLGDLRQALKKIKKLLKPGGVMIFEGAYSLPGKGVVGYETEAEILSHLEHSDFQVVDKVIWERDLIVMMNQKNNEYIQQRVHELKIEYPQDTAVLDAYFQNQIQECRQLENELTCITFLLQ